MSLITYNGISIPYSSQTSFSMESVYEDSKTDRLYNKYTVSTMAVINKSYLPIMGGDAAGDNAAAIMKSVHEKLMAQKKDFSVTFNGTELLPSTSGVDAANGPQPQYCKLTDLTNETFMLDYCIVANYCEAGGSAILSNRWSETVVLDQMNYSIRTRTGKYFMRSDNTAKLIADQFRNSFAVTGVPPGFQRTRAEYTVDPSGLALQFTIEDREVFKQPPSPAYKAEGSYTETGRGAGGAKRYGRCRVKLYGSKETDQSALVRAAITIAAGKLRISAGEDVNGVGKGFGPIYETSVTVDMYENIVEAMCFGLHKPRFKNDPKNRLNRVAGIPFDAMTFTPLTDDANYNPTYLDRGTAKITLQAAAYADPALRQALNKQTNQLEGGKEVGRG